MGQQLSTQSLGFSYKVCVVGLRGRGTELGGLRGRWFPRAGASLGVMEGAQGSLGKVEGWGLMCGGIR